MNREGREGRNSEKPVSRGWWKAVKGEGGDNFHAIHVRPRQIRNSGIAHPLLCSVKRIFEPSCPPPRAPVKSRRDTDRTPRTPWPLDNEQFAHHFPVFCASPVRTRAESIHMRSPEGSPAGRRMFVSLFLERGLYLGCISRELG